jgi:hypothetical protein
MCAGTFADIPGHFATRVAGKKFGAGTFFQLPAGPALGRIRRQKNRPKPTENEIKAPPF